MDFEILKEQWLQEEHVAHIQGWDFSHIHGRYEVGRDIPWNYEAIVRRFLLNSSKLLDIDTGGGEFLLGLNHPYKNTSATEGYPPNVALCKTILLPLGIDFRETTDVRQLPFSDSIFDMVINRHGDFSAEEIFRVLKPNGLFITQQVGAQNDRELVELLLPNTRIPYPEQYLEKAIKKFTNAGFEILESQEAVKSQWSTRQLERQINSFFYERLLASKDKASVAAEIQTLEQAKKPEDIIRDPYVLEFHERELMNEGDNPPIGIVLCADKSEAVVRFTLPENETQIFASKYKLYLPSEEELLRELKQEYQALEAGL